jgi:hypothetical protein
MQFNITIQHKTSSQLTINFQLKLEEKKKTQCDDVQSDETKPQKEHTLVCLSNFVDKNKYKYKTDLD